MRTPSTLLKVLAGEYEVDSGRLDIQRGKRVGMLPQHPSFESGLTVHQAASQAFAALDDIRSQLEGVYESMAEANADQLDSLLSQQSDLEARLEAAGFSSGYRGMTYRG